MFGYLLVVPKNTTFPSSVENEIEVLYETENAIHVKNERMRQLDREIGDIKMEIIDIETNAMLKFVFSILEIFEISISIYNFDLIRTLLFMVFCYIG